MGASFSFPTMAWLPDHIWLAQKLLGGSRKGKGKGKGNRTMKGSGKGKGKGKWRRSSIVGGNVKKGKVVWIGGLKERETKDRDLNKQLQEFINKKVEGCKFVDISRKGSGAAVFGSEDEASSAISALNGIKFKGQLLEFDVWTKEE